MATRPRRNNDNELTDYIDEKNRIVKAQNKYFQSAGCDEQLELFTMDTEFGCQMLLQAIENDSEPENVTQDGELPTHECRQWYAYYERIERLLRRHMLSQNFVTNTVSQT